MKLSFRVVELAQKWQIGDWMGPPTLRYQGNVDGPCRPLWYERLVAIGKPIRPDGHFALLSDQRDRDALENRRSQVSCKHFVVPSTMSRHAHLARSPV